MRLYEFTIFFIGQHTRFFQYQWDLSSHLYPNNHAYRCDAI
jgi:hypothetical protein